MKESLEGKVFYESWGYDQTNIDFLKVIRVSPTGKTVLCQMVSKKDVGNDQVAPGDVHGVVFRLGVRLWKYNGKDEVSLRGKYPFCQNTYPSCKLFKREDIRVFECVQKLPEIEGYRYWDGGKKAAWCKGCVNYFEEPNVSFREDGSFMKYDHPVYETPFGMGH